MPKKLSEFSEDERMEFIGFLEERACTDGILTLEEVLEGSGVKVKQVMAWAAADAQFRQELEWTQTLLDIRLLELAEERPELRAKALDVAMRVLSKSDRGYGSF